MMLPPPPTPRPGLVWPLERPPGERRYRDGLGDQRPAKGPPVRHHAGIDLRAAYGEVVRAKAPGKVISTFDWSGRCSAETPASASPKPGKSGFW